MTRLVLVLTKPTSVHGPEPATSQSQCAQKSLSLAAAELIAISVKTHSLDRSPNDKLESVEPFKILLDNDGE